MSPFDRIIGYQSIRKELERTADALRNTEKYSRLGASAPRGLLLWGEPGVGKTLMAFCLIEASGRKHFICRKNQPDGDFVKDIRKVFEQAIKAAPSIVFLDDLDKFANNDEDHKDSDEYVTVQSCIDAAKDLEVFVLATANSIDDLPDSLIRVGRFDRCVRVTAPPGQDAVEIIRHYLSSKAFVSDIDPEVVAGIMAGFSCAELETAVNKAGLLAGYEGCERINARHLILGCLDIAHRISPDSILTEKSGEKRRNLVKQVAYHEAGHAVVCEALFPGTVSAVCIYESRGEVSGLTAHREIDSHDLHSQLLEAIIPFGGRASTRLVFGCSDAGSGKDLEYAKRILNSHVTEDGALGFSLLDSMYENSQELMHLQEQAISAKMEACAQEAERLIAADRGLLTAIANELIKKGLMLAEDIRRLKQTVSS